MEFESSSMQHVMPPSGICTEPFCTNSSGASYNRPCQSCNNAFRLKILDNLDGTVADAKIPSSVLSHLRHEASLASTGPSEQDWRNTRKTRPHITIPHQKPQYNHFNAYGEAIFPHPSLVQNRIGQHGSPQLCLNCRSKNSMLAGQCSNCRPTSMPNINPTPRIFGINNSSFQPPSKLPDLATMSTASARNIHPINLNVNKLDGYAQRDVGLDNLEFSYGVSPTTYPTERSLPSSCRDKLGKPPGRQYIDPSVIIRPPLSSSNNKTSSNVEPGPPKRQKLSHHTMLQTWAEPKSSSAPQAPNNAMRPNMDKSTINAGPSSKLCSSANCTTTISNSSTATRCLPCVKREWKSRRESKAVQPIIPKRQSSIKVQDHGGVNGKGKKKSVTWGDVVFQRYSSPPSTSLTTEVDPSDMSTPFSGPIDDDVLDLEHYLNLDGLVEDPDPSENSLTISKVLPTVTANDDPANPALTSTVKTEFPTPSLESKNDDSPKENLIAGWDSDLTDLSDSPEAEPGIKPSSGLKIRIPARPTSKTCSSQKCDQILKFGYRQKLCIICRARRRDVNRKKRGIVTVHQSLVEVLTGDENMGTPLSTDLQKHIAQVKLVQGARLCSIKTCTYIIPPADEYIGNKCTFCRLRGAEREKLEKEAGRRPSRRSKLLSQPSFWLQQLNHDVTDTMGETGRCRRYGCGMFLSDCSAQECKQCIGRHNWLTNKITGDSAVFEGPITRHVGSQKPLYSPPPLTLYPNYKSCSSALKEFKNLLSDFLRAQSIFFLFHQPRPSASFFAFDAEYSTVTLDFDLEKRKEELEADIMKLKEKIEYVGRINFNPNSKRLVSVPEGAGFLVRFSCHYSVPMMQSSQGGDVIGTFIHYMQCELEIAVFPDYSHRFIPGQRTVIRFRLLG